jgi:hypothetical protein
VPAFFAVGEDRCLADRVRALQAGPCVYVGHDEATGRAREARRPAPILVIRTHTDYQTGPRSLAGGV